MAHVPEATPQDAVQIVTVATAEAGEPLVASLHARLSPHEQARAARFVRPADRRTYVIAHALVRVTLSEHAPRAPDAWQFATGVHGRPAIAAPPAGAEGLTFSLSHTSGLAAVAVTRRRSIGVDVEQVTRAVSERVAEARFAPAEIQALRALPADERRRAFFDYWTLKEAYVKARGHGLTLPLDGFAFTIAGDVPPAIAFAAGTDDRAERWQFHLSWPTAEHRLALAVEREGPDLPIAWRATTAEALCP
ncbi:MAG: 4'-phosphopantetheinyl transferase superfamily protein [Vicinamibacterales bacterium]